jgi:hypothetical protein
MRLADGAQSGTALVDLVDGDVLEIEYIDDLLASLVQCCHSAEAQRRRTARPGLSARSAGRGLVSLFEEPDSKLTVCRDYRTVEFLGFVWFFTTADVFIARTASEFWTEHGESRVSNAIG